MKIPPKQVPVPAQVFNVGAEISKTAEDLVLASFPGVFRHGRLDYGTQLMLESMQIPESAVNILDLGCGSGALGIAAAKRAPKAKVTFVDESYTAIESVKESIRLSLPESSADKYQTLAINCLEGITDDSKDLILNNPPFHDAAAKTSGIALEMFRQSKRVLREHGHLQVIANRHLGYHKRLKEVFGNCKTIASNEKFVVLLSEKH